jgi:hypothetical protein
MDRRDFSALVDGAAAMWPLAARSPQPRVKRVGLLFPGQDGDPRLSWFVLQGA